MVSGGSDGVMNMEMTLKEKISAMIDGELDAAELNQVLDAMRSDSELRELYGRYCLAQAGLHDEVGMDVAGRIRGRLEVEPTVFAPGAIRVPIQPRTRKFVAGVAIAASVAAVSVFGLRWFGQESATPQLIATAPEQADYIRASGTKWSASDPGLENDLNTYLVEHGGYSGASGMNGLMSYVKVAGYDGGNDQR